MVALGGRRPLEVMPAGYVRVMAEVMRGPTGRGQQDDVTPPSGPCGRQRSRARSVDPGAGCPPEGRPTSGLRQRAKR